MSDEQPSPPAEPVQAAERIPFSSFLENVAPGRSRQVTVAASKRAKLGNTVIWAITLPEIQLYCPSDTCNREMFFRGLDDFLETEGGLWEPDLTYARYMCANCRRYIKTFALQIEVDLDKEGEYLGLSCYKFGEDPHSCPPTPSRLISLLGPGRELLLNGRRCENQGLGIGAFVYYRRVVEDQKNRILREIMKVAESVGASAGVIAALKAAQEEHQFSKAMGDVKDSIPQRLLIQGQNLLTLLHAAL
jgi:hypothetical protein